MELNPYYLVGYGIRYYPEGVRYSTPGEKLMTDPEKSKLKLKDIKFLRAVRDINESPEQYSSTDGGAVPATVGAIEDATDLSQGDINYRAQPSRSRLAELGYLKIHKSQVHDAGYGPKSFELTPEGDQALEEAMVAHGLTEADTSELRDSQQLKQVAAQTSNHGDRIQSLETRVEELAGKVSQLEETIRRYEESPTGAMSSSERDKIEALISRVPANSEVLEALGVNLSELEAAETRDEIDIEAIRDQVREAVLDGEGQPVTGEASEGGTSAEGGSSAANDASIGSFTDN